MRTIYQIDSDRIATGISRELGPQDGRPRGWVVSDVPPPDGLAQWNNGEWVVIDSRPPAPDLYPDTDTARAAMLGWINDLTAKITSKYPAAEVASWPSKAEAARAVVAGTARQDQTDMIQAEADLTGASLGDQAAAIVAKAQVYEAIVSKTSGLRQATDAALVAATTSAEREAALDAAMTAAAAMAAEYGLQQ